MPRKSRRASRCQLCLTYLNPLQVQWQICTCSRGVFALPLALIVSIRWLQAAQPSAAAQEPLQQLQSAALPAQRPVFKGQRSMLAAARGTDGAAVLPPPAAVSGRGVNDGPSGKQAHALAHADASAATERLAESADAHRQPALPSRAHGVTKTELRARGAEKVRRQGPAQSQHRTQQTAHLQEAQPSLAAQPGLQSPDARQHGNRYSQTGQKPVAHEVDAEQSVPAQPTPPSTSCHDALISPTHGREGRPSGGKSALILTAKGTTIELHSRGVSSSGCDPDSEATASGDGGARCCARHCAVQDAAAQCGAGLNRINPSEPATMLLALHKTPGTCHICDNHRSLS